MKKIVTILAITLASVLSASAIVGYDFTIITSYKSGGPDTQGMNGASMKISVTLDEPTYTDHGGNIYTTPSAVSVTISGSTNPDNNGTFFLDASGTISTPRFSTNNNNAGLLYSTGFGYVNLALDNATISMGFAGLAIIDDIAGGDPILASDYNGINLKANTLTITTDGAVATYDYGSTTVSAATVVPEPASTAAIAGAFGLAVVFAFRRYRRARVA